MIKKDIAIIMGSKNDWAHIESLKPVLDEFKVSYHVEVVSAHRTPEKMYTFAKNAENHYKVIIAAAGGAAHLPGMVASLTVLPVIGIPVKSSKFSGIDSVMSILQMPYGTPTAVVGVDAGNNAALLALKILALSDQRICQELKDHKNKMQSSVQQSQQELEKELWNKP